MIKIKSFIINILSGTDLLCQQPTAHFKILWFDYLNVLFAELKSSESRYNIMNHNPAAGVCVSAESVWATAVCVWLIEWCEELLKVFMMPFTLSALQCDVKAIRLHLNMLIRTFQLYNLLDECGLQSQHCGPLRHLTCPTWSLSPSQVTHFGHAGAINLNGTGVAVGVGSSWGIIEIGAGLRRIDSNLRCPHFSYAKTLIRTYRLQGSRVRFTGCVFTHLKHARFKCTFM